MARPKGSKTRNNADDGRTFAIKVEQMLVKSGEYTNLAAMVCRKLHSMNPKESMPILLRLLEMRYGKAAQPITGADGGPMKMIVEHIQAE